MMFHISFAETWFCPERPNTGKTVTFTFWVSQAATAKVTGGLSLAVLQKYNSLSASITYHKKDSLIRNHQLEEETIKTCLWCRSTPDTPSSALPILEDQTMSKNNPKKELNKYRLYLLIYLHEGLIVVASWIMRKTSNRILSLRKYH